MQRVVGQNGCSKLAPGSLNGSIALARRGKCTFHKKALNVREAGATALVVVNTAGRPLFAMTDDSSNPPSHLPAVLVQEDSGAYLEKRVEEEEQLGEAVKVTLSLVCTSTYRDGVVHTCDTFEPSLPI